jgi:hypothetical protein
VLRTNVGDSLSPRKRDRNVPLLLSAMAYSPSLGAVWLAVGVRITTLRAKASAAWPRLIVEAAGDWVVRRPLRIPQLVSLLSPPEVEILMPLKLSVHYGAKH